MEIPDTSPPPAFKRISSSENQSSFGLRGIVSDIRRGQDVLYFPSGVGSDGYLCNSRVDKDAIVTWAEGRDLIGGWASEEGVIFYDTMTDMGYSVPGNPKNLFTENSGAEYMIAARLTSMHGNICHAHDWLVGRPLRKFSGEMYLEFEWSIQNSLTKEVILTRKTNGYYKQKRAVGGGISIAYQEAFAAALEKFAALPEVRKLALGEPISAAKVTNSDVKHISILNGRPSRHFKPADGLRYLVRINVGNGHGSGFIIGRDGYVLTNAHVVGGANFVQVSTGSGLSVKGKVIARNKTRDVALIKTPLQLQYPISIRKTRAPIGANVYVMGAPAMMQLRNTVTKGIVSAYRRSRSSGLELLQSDAPMSPGNSGGPMVDEQGRVIGITVSMISKKDTTGIGFYIPIMDAFDKLPIDLK